MRLSQRSRGLRIPATVVRRQMLASFDSTKGPVRIANGAPRRDAGWFLLAALLCAFDNVFVLIICLQLLELADLIMRSLGSAEDCSVTRLNWGYLLARQIQRGNGRGSVLPDG